MSKQRLPFLLGCLLVAAVALMLMHRSDPDAAIAASMGEATTKHATLLGYEKYTGRNHQRIRGGSLGNRPRYYTKLCELSTV